MVLVPTLAGLVLGVLVRHFPRVRGSGVTQTKSAVYIYDGYIPFDTVIGKFLMCALAIGSGQSLGPEDPSLQMGAGLASALGRRLHLSRDKVRLIAPVGAAAGLAAAFNSRICRGAVCDRRSDRYVERGNSGCGGAGGGGERGGGAPVFGGRAVISDSTVSHGASGRAHHLRSTRRGGRVVIASIREITGVHPATFQGVASLDAIFATSRWRDWRSESSPGSFRR